MVVLFLSPAIEYLFDQDNTIIYIDHACRDGLFISLCPITMITMNVGLTKIWDERESQHIFCRLQKIGLTA